MADVIGWLFDFIPTWVLAVAGLLAAAITWRLLGLRGLLAATAAIIAAGTYRAGRTHGAASATDRQNKANEKAVNDHAEIKAETGCMSDAELDAANDPWVRKRR